MTDQSTTYKISTTSPNRIKELRDELGKNLGSFAKLDYIRNEAGRKKAILINGPRINEAIIIEAAGKSFNKGELNIQQLNDRRVAEPRIRKETELYKPQSIDLLSILSSIARSAGYEEPRDEDVRTRDGISNYTLKLTQKINDDLEKLEGIETAREIFERTYSILEILAKTLGQDISSRKSILHSQSSIRDTRDLLEIGVEEFGKRERKLLEREKGVNNLEALLVEVGNALDVERPKLQDLIDEKKFEDWSGKYLDALDAKTKEIEKLRITVSKEDVARYKKILVEMINPIARTADYKLLTEEDLNQPELLEKYIECYKAALQLVVKKAQRIDANEQIIKDDKDRVRRGLEGILLHLEADSITTALYLRNDDPIYSLLDVANKIKKLPNDRIIALKKIGEIAEIIGYRKPTDKDARTYVAHKIYLEGLVVTAKTRLRDLLGEKNKVTEELGLIDLEILPNLYSLGDLVGYTERARLKSGIEGLKEYVTNLTAAVERNLEEKRIRIEETERIRTQEQKLAETEKLRLEEIIKNGATDNLTSEELLVEAFRKVYGSKLDEAILEYNTKFPEGIPENIVLAKTEIEEIVYERLESKLTDIDKGKKIEEIEEILKSRQLEFEETEYYLEHNEQYKVYKAFANTFKHKRDEALSEEENSAKTFVINYEGAKKEYYRIKNDTSKILIEIEEIKKERQRSIEETADFIKDNLPLKSVFGCYVFYTMEEDVYRIRFIMPTNKDNFRESAAIDFSLNIAHSLKGRNGEISTGEIRNCNYIDLKYKNIDQIRIENLVEKTKLELQNSEISRLGAKIEIKYLGEFKLQ